MTDATKPWQEWLAAGNQVAVVTFTLPPDRYDGKADPIGYLPDGRTYGIVDRAYRLVAAPGETWVVGLRWVGRALFLVPLQRIGLDELVELDPALLSGLAAHLAGHRPDLVLELAGHLAKSSPPKPSPSVPPPAWRQAVGEARNRILDAQSSLARARDDLEALGRRPDRAELPLWLADANLFINAARWGWPADNELLDVAGLRFRLATTKAIQEELLHSYRLPLELEVFDVGPPDEDLLQAARANASAAGKMASRRDLSLVMLARRNPAVRGIISEDEDLHRLHVTSLVGRPIECLRAREFLAKHAALVPGAKP